MARRRYLSTDVSKDKVVNRLALEAGDFAVLLYTWMIPHAGDDATVEGDPEELLMIAMPGRRDKQPEDVAEALAAMDGLGLVEWDRAGAVVRFPGSFYKHQSYVTEKRRRAAGGAPNAAPPREAPPSARDGEDRGNAPPGGDDAEQPRTSPHKGANERAEAQNAASLKSSFSSSFSSPSPTTPLPPLPGPDDPVPRGSPPTAAEPDPAQRPSSPSGYVDLLNSRFPAISASYTEADPVNFTATWLRGVLAEAERDVGPLDRERLTDGLDVALTRVQEALRSASAAYPIRHPRAFAKRTIVEALREVAA